MFMQSRIEEQIERALRNMAGMDVGSDTYLRAAESVAQLTLAYSRLEDKD